MIKLLNLFKESVSNPIIPFMDMDGVLVNFDKGFEKISGGIPCKVYDKEYGIEAFWKLIDSHGSEFWSNLEWMPEGRALWDHVKGHNPVLLSAPSRDPVSKIGKELWRDKHIPGAKLIFASRQDKKYYAEPNHVLVDDRNDNVQSWIEAGGVGIVYVSTQQAIKDLKKLGI